MPLGNMKETLKTVAIDLFFQKGYFATSISDIAQGAGIQKASIYYHYSSKEALLFSILLTTMDDLTTYLKQNIAGVADIEEQMRAAVRSHVVFHLERQKENFIANSELRWLSQENCRAIVAKRDEYEAVFQDILSKGVEGGVFAQRDVKILSYAILTLCTAGAAWYNPAGRLSIAEIANIYENFIINGLASRRRDPAG